MRSRPVSINAVAFHSRLHGKLQVEMITSLSSSTFSKEFEEIAANNTIWHVTIIQDWIDLCPIYHHLVDELPVFFPFRYFLYHFTEYLLSAGGPSVTLKYNMFDYVSTGVGHTYIYQNHFSQYAKQTIWRPQVPLIPVSGLSRAYADCIPTKVLIQVF